MARASRDPEDRIRERNRRVIIKAGIEIFSRKGFDGTRISEIAEASGLPKANVYYYFSSKEEIYTAIIEHLIAGWDDALKYIRSDSEPAEAFRLYIRAKLDYTRKNVAESRLFASEIIQGARFLKKKDRQHMRDITDRHVAVVDGWIAEGKMVPVDARHLFIMLWAATQFYADFEPVAADGLNKTRLKAEDYETAARTISETVLRGIIVDR